MNLIKEWDKQEKERMQFIDRWAEYVKTHSDREWGKQHARFINREMKKLELRYKDVTREQYLQLKGERTGPFR